jgi:hypothetical protein
MKIRRLQYNIDYTHILTFKEEYKSAIIPYFGLDNLRYGIDNENSINESIRLIFMSETIALFIRKEGITFLFEGDVDDLRNPTGVSKFFWDIYEKIKLFKGYKKTNRHSLIVHAVKIMDKTEVEGILSSTPYFTVNPFGSLNEFATNYEFKKDDKSYKFTFGNFSEKDIKIHDMTPFKTEFNKDLIDNLGVMCKLEIYEDCKAITSFGKFKSLLNDAEGIISSYKLPKV